MVFPQEVFPQEQNGFCVVALVIGTSGFSNDYPLAQLPGLRRSFLRLMSNDEKSFCKTSFTDTTSACLSLPKVATEQDNSDPYANLRNQIEKYKNVILASRVLNPNNEDDQKVLKAWLATYAYYRDWAKNQAQVNAVSKAISDCITNPNTQELDEIEKLLAQRHFVVLQGAPGTGKTYNAMQIAKNFAEENVFFEQFHAETTYADFVWGIKPKLNSTNLEYEANQGILYQAIKKAKENPQNEEVLLIIDEINRANLANVLGPVFYLFEYQTNNEQEQRPATVKIGDLEINQLPTNLYVIATMNTADRSLAVVDFALRRRFAWYTIFPHKININNDQNFKFHEQAFDDITRLFDKYATDEELNLQPGPSYFITNGKNDNEHEALFKERVIYELMPLMKEYFTEGLMVKARDEFSKLFYNMVQKHLFL